VALLCEVSVKIVRGGFVMKNAMKVVATFVLGTIAAVSIHPDPSEQHDSDSLNAPKHLVAENDLTGIKRSTMEAVLQDSSESEAG
jgi:hypothetical protein